MKLDLGDSKLIIDACLAHELLRNQCAFVLATAFHETGHVMKPVRETSANSDAKAKEILTKAWRAGKLPWVKADYWSSGYFGRGYVQLTHKANYQKASAELGVDLTGNPGLALNPDIAAEILVLGMKFGWFTGQKLSDHITLNDSDFFDARAIINGDKNKPVVKGQKKLMGELIAEIAIAYNSLLLQAGYGIEKAPAAPVQPVPNIPPPVEAAKPVAPPVGFPVDPGTVVIIKDGSKSKPEGLFWRALWAVLNAIFGRKK